MNPEELEDIIPDGLPEPEQPEPPQPQEPQPQSSKLADRWKQFRENSKNKKLRGVEERANKARQKIPTLAQQGVKEGLEKKAKGEAAELAVKGGVKLGAKVGSRIVPYVGWALLALDAIKAVFNPKVWRFILYSIGGLLLLLAVIFGLVGLKLWPGLFPSTEAQKNQAVAVAYLGGNFVLGGKVTAHVYKEERARYDRILANVARTNPERNSEVKSKVTEILALMDQSQALSGKAKETMVKQVIAKVQALDSTLPFGTWITESAKSKLGHPSSEFNSCAPTRACASFTSTVLYEAGVPSPIKEAVDQIWLNPALSLLVDRPATEGAALHSANKDKLQPGDIIFWGDGKGGGVSTLFNHVGFYIGNGQAIDNSSRDLEIKQRDASKRGQASLYFNGAKRYGSKL